MVLIANLFHEYVITQISKTCTENNHYSQDNEEQ